MVPALDIFAANDGQAKWLGCTETLAHAILFLRDAGSGSYFVFTQQTGYKDYYQVSKDGVCVPSG
jgi:hypothetical protein